MTPSDVISSFVYNNCTVFVLRSGDITISKDRIITDGCAVLDRNFNFFESLHAVKLIFECDFFQFVQNISFGAYSYLIKLSALGHLLCQNRSGLPFMGFVCVDDPQNKNIPSPAIGKSLFCRAVKEMGMGQLITHRNFCLDNGAFWGVDPRKSPLIVQVGDLKSALSFLAPVVVGSAKFLNKAKNAVVTVGSDTPRLLLESNSGSWDFAAGNEYSEVFTPLHFSDFFGLEFTPKDFFQHILFDEWSEYEWNRFDNLMIWCQSIYLKGLASGNNEF